MTNLKHGMTGTPEYQCWAQIKVRCSNHKHPAFPDYGGRGISVCRAWVSDFRAFYEHVGPRPSPEHSIDRYPNNDGNYEPGNVRWATKAEQTANRRACKVGAAHKNSKHGGCRTPEYKTWRSIQSRCFNVKHDLYPRYGGRGITMCGRWRGSFEAFLSDVGARPSTGHIMSRTDTAGHYCCGFCAECRGLERGPNCAWMRKVERNQTRKSIKLSTAAAAEIRSLLQAGRPVSVLARRYEVAQSLIAKIGRGEVWV